MAAACLDCHVYLLWLIGYITLQIRVVFSLIMETQVLNVKFQKLSRPLAADGVSDDRTGPSSDTHRSTKGESCTLGEPTQPCRRSIKQFLASVI